MIMNGWTRKYKESLERTGDPIVLSQCRKMVMDLPGLMTYAKKNGKRVVELTEEEKRKFISNSEQD